MSSGLADVSSLTGPGLRLYEVPQMGVAGLMSSRPPAGTWDEWPRASFQGYPAQLGPRCRKALRPEVTFPIQPHQTQVAATAVLTDLCLTRTSLFGVGWLLAVASWEGPGPVGVGVSHTSCPPRVFTVCDAQPVQVPTLPNQPCLPFLASAPYL